MTDDIIKFWLPLKKCHLLDLFSGCFSKSFHGKQIPFPMIDLTCAFLAIFASMLYAM